MQRDPEALGTRKPELPNENGLVAEIAAAPTEFRIDGKAQQSRLRALAPNLPGDHSGIAPVGQAFRCQLLLNEAAHRFIKHDDFFVRPARLLDQFKHSSLSAAPCGSRHRAERPRR